LNRQPWKFIVIEDKKVIKLVSDETKALMKQLIPQMAKEVPSGLDETKAKQFMLQMAKEEDVICYDAPVLVFVCTEKSDSMTENSGNLIDSVLATQNMFLKAYELGLGTCFMGFVNFLNNKPEALKKIGVPDDYQMMVPFILGHPKAKQGAGKRNKPDSKWVK
jgi:nitroreductase